MNTNGHYYAGGAHQVTIERIMFDVAAALIPSWIAGIIFFGFSGSMDSPIEYCRRSAYRSADYALSVKSRRDYC